MDFKKVLLVCVTSLLLIAAVVFFFFNNSAPTKTEKPPMDAEVAKILQEVATKKEVAEGFKKADSNLHAVQNKLEEDMAAGFAKRDSNLARFEAKVDNYHRIPPRASLPARKPVAPQQTVTNPPPPRPARVTTPASTNSAGLGTNTGDFITRREFSREIDSLKNILTNFQATYAMTTATTAFILDTVVRTLGRLAGHAIIPRTDTTRTNSSVGQPARPQTEAPPSNSTSERRHAY